MGQMNQPFPGPQVGGGSMALGYPTTANGLPYDPEVEKILANPFYAPPARATAGSSGGQTGMGGLGNAAGAAMKVAPFLMGGGSEAAIAGLGGAGMSLAGGMGAGATGMGAASGTAGIGGVLPGYTGTATGIFGSGMGAAGGAGGASAGGAATGAAAAGEGAAAGGLGSLGAMAGVALPVAVLLGGLSQMFKPGTSPGDISSQWSNGLAKDGSSKMDPATFNQFRGEQAHLDALLNLATKNGQFDQNQFNQSLAQSTVGGKHFEGKALEDARLFGQTYANNPALWGSRAEGPGDWQQRLYADQGGG